MHFGFINEVKMKSGTIIAGLDIGTTRVSVIVAEVNYEGSSKNVAVHNGIKGFDIDILGIGNVHSSGIKKGVVTNIESTVESIREAVREAEAASGIDVGAVYAGITGSHVNCLSSSGVIAVKGQEIGENEVDSVIDAASAVALPFDREILHVIPVEYTIDGQGEITDPRGMGGVRLETDVQIITGNGTSVRNLMKSCEKAGLDVADVVFQPLASAGAVLTQDEKDLGVAIIDIGGGTTDIALFKDGNICHSAVLALGGNNFTNDVAIGLRIRTQEAEKIKKKYGCSMISLIGEDDEVAIGGDEKPGRTIPKNYLVEILQPRAEELFSLIKEEITGKGHYNNMNSGVVLTGGAVMMEGMDVMAEHILELPVRIGSPRGPGGMTNDLRSPGYATAIGLVMYGAREHMSDRAMSDTHAFSEITTRMRGWVGGLFSK